MQLVAIRAVEKLAILVAHRERILGPLIYGVVRHRAKSALLINGLRQPKFREPASEHRAAAFRLTLSRLVLKYVPMLGQTTVLDPDDVGGNPRDGATRAGEATVNNDVIAFCHDELMFVVKIGRRIADQVEQAVSTGLDVSTMLDIVL